MLDEIRRIFNERNLTAYQLGQKTGISQLTISKLIDNKGTPSKTTINKLYAYLTQPNGETENEEILRLRKELAQKDELIALYKEKLTNYERDLINKVNDIHDMLHKNEFKNVIAKFEETVSIK